MVVTADACLFFLVDVVVVERIEVGVVAFLTFTSPSSFSSFTVTSDSHFFFSVQLPIAVCLYGEPSMEVDIDEVGS